MFEEWTGLLETVDAMSRVPAMDLYSGVAWSATRDAATALAGLGVDPQLWIVSAGYGLVRSDRPLVSYEAAFSPGKVDSVATSSDGHAVVNRQWWELLSGWRPHGYSDVRTVAALARQVDAMLVVMSPRYLDAARRDLLAAVRSNPSVVVISGGLPEFHPLAPFAAQFDKRLREPSEVTGAPRLVAASDMSLNQRVAEHLIRHLGVDAFDRNVSAAYLDRAMTSRRPARTFAHRTAANDAEVVSFVRTALHEDPTAKKTNLLQAWRSSGRQCEQKRFGRLFAQAAASMESEVGNTPRAELPR